MVKYSLSGKLAFAEGAVPGLVLCVLTTPVLVLVTTKSMNVCDIV
jgi:hypothetical protein